MVTKCPINMIANFHKKPTDPTAIPHHKNLTAPKIVEIAVKKTGNVPKFAFVEINDLLIV